MSHLEAKLKQLKVAELKDILQKASVALPAKANKADLIAKILSTPAAVETYNGQNSPNGATLDKPPPTVQPSAAGVDNDLLAPPEQFEWESTTTTAIPSKPEAPTPAKQATVATATQGAKPTAAKPSAPATVTTTPAPTVKPNDSNSKPAADDEVERRKKRAERFGVPLVEPKRRPAPVAKASQKPAEDVAKLEARASRFGVPVAKPGQKRGRSPIPVDKDEEEKRRKRAERFGNVGTKSQS